MVGGGGVRSGVAGGWLCIGEKPLDSRMGELGGLWTERLGGADAITSHDNDNDNEEMRFLRGAWVEMPPEAS